MAVIPAPRPSPAAWTVDTVRAGLLALTEVEHQRGPRVARWDGRRRGGASLRGWRSPGERHNGGHRAEVKGEDTPEGVQPLLGRAVGEAAAGRDAWRGSVRARLGPPRGAFEGAVFISY